MHSAAMVVTSLCKMLREPRDCHMLTGWYILFDLHVVVQDSTAFHVEH